MFTNELKKLYGGPTDVIGNNMEILSSKWLIVIKFNYLFICVGGYSRPSAKRLRLPALKPAAKAKKFKAGDHYALRTPEGGREQ